MKKGDKARVIRDCAVRAGSVVDIEDYHKEITGFMRLSPKMEGFEFVVRPAKYTCYFNNVRFEIAESDLKFIKKIKGKE